MGRHRKSAQSPHVLAIAADMVKLLRCSARRAEHLGVSHHRGSGHTFVVSTSLGTAQIDTARLAKARLKAVMAEVKRIRRSDRRVRGAKLRPVSSVEGGKYLLELTIAAPSGYEAFEIGSAVVRASIHTAGGSTAGWETNVVPQLAVGAMRGRVRPTTPSSWAEVTATAARHAAALPVLPSFDPALAPVAQASPRLAPSGYIDLR